MKTYKSGSALLGLSLVLAWAALGAASPTSTTLGAAGMGTGANAIVVQAQDVNAGQVWVNAVTAAQDGWLLIRTDKNGAPGDVIGFVAVRRGTSTNLRVDIQTTDVFGNDYVTSTLWATLVADPNAPAPFASPGPSITRYTSAVVVAFASSTAQGPTAGETISSGATNGNSITVRAQDVEAGQVIVDSVTAAKDSWLLIRQDKKGVPGDMIGFARVQPGTATNVRVDVQLTDYYGDDNITPTLWATLVADPSALTLLASPDPLITQKASAAVVAFSSSVAGAAASSPAVSVSSAPSAASANRITTHAQATFSGRVIVDSVTAAQDGWLLICKNANGGPGQVLGFAPVHKGLNTTRVVDIRTTNAEGDSIATPVLWATLVADSNALVSFALPNAAVQQAGSLASVAFSTR